MPEAAHNLAGLGDIAERYDAVLCDVWGVVHNGERAFTACVEALAKFRATGGTVIMLTNAPRPAEDIPLQFSSLGVPRNCWDDIVTSGDATKALLARRAPGPAFKLGPSKDERLYQDTGLLFSPLKDAQLISCTGLFDDRKETPDDYTELLSTAVKLKLPMVCANPDIIAHFGNQTLYCGGALAQAYAAMGGEVILGGKPHDPIYALSFSRIEALRSKPVKRSRILAIGDGLATDVMGAAVQGLDCIFITGGIHSAQVGNGKSAKAVARLLDEHDTNARYFMTALCW